MSDSGRRILILPPAPALSQTYASLHDPLAALRSACAQAVGWLGPSVEILADDVPARLVGVELLGRGSTPGAPDLLVMANGTACRSERAPGHLDPRAATYDEWLGNLLRIGDLAGLAELEVGEGSEGSELLTAGLRSLRVAARRLLDQGMQVTRAEVDYSDDPYGVQYWVVRWQCES